MTARTYTSTEKADLVELHLQGMRDQLDRKTYVRKGMPADDVERARDRLAYRIGGVAEAVVDLRRLAADEGRAGA